MLSGRANGVRGNAFILLTRLHRYGPMIGRQLHFDTLTGNHEPYHLHVLVNAELDESARKVLHRIDIALDADQEAFVPLFFNCGRTDRVLCESLFDPQSRRAKANAMCRHYRTARPASLQPDHHERTSMPA